MQRSSGRKSKTKAIPTESQVRKEVVQRVLSEQQERIDLQVSRERNEKLKEAAHVELCNRLTAYRYSRTPHRTWAEIASDLVFTSEEQLYAVWRRSRYFSRDKFLDIHKRLAELETAAGIKERTQLIWPQ